MRLCATGPVQARIEARCVVRTNGASSAPNPDAGDGEGARREVPDRHLARLERVREPELVRRVDARVRRVAVVIHLMVPRDRLPAALGEDRRRRVAVVRHLVAGATRRWVAGRRTCSRGAAAAREAGAARLAIRSGSLSCRFSAPPRPPHQGGPGTARPQRSGRTLNRLAPGCQRFRIRGMSEARATAGLVGGRMLALAALVLAARHSADERFARGSQRCWRCRRSPAFALFAAGAVLWRRARRRPRAPARGRRPRGRSCRRCRSRTRAARSLFTARWSSALAAPRSPGPRCRVRRLAAARAGGCSCDRRCLHRLGGLAAVRRSSTRARRAASPVRGTSRSCTATSRFARTLRCSSAEGGAARPLRAARVVLVAYERLRGRSVLADRHRLPGVRAPCPRRPAATATAPCSRGRAGRSRVSALLGRRRGAAGGRAARVDRERADRRHRARSRARRPSSSGPRSPRARATGRSRLGLPRRCCVAVRERAPTSSAAERSRGAPASAAARSAPHGDLPRAAPGRRARARARGRRGRASERSSPS